MKKNQLEKLIKGINNAVVKLDEDEGTYYVSLPGSDIVALAMREVDPTTGKEKFVDKWAVYPVSEDGNRDSVYTSLHDSVLVAIETHKVDSVLKAISSQK